MEEKDDTGGQLALFTELSTMMIGLFALYSLCSASK